VAGAYLSGKVARASNPDIYQVIVHVGPEALSAQPAAGDPSTAPSAVRGTTSQTKTSMITTWLGEYHNDRGPVPW
jgi:hypothetical protein